MVRDNQQWLDELQSDDVVTRDEATNALQDRLRKSIFKQFLGKGLSGSCIDDVVQETTFRIFNRLDTFRRESAFLTWATAFAIRTGMEMLRRGFWSARTASDFTAATNAIDLADQWKSSSPSPETLAQQAEVLGHLTRAMNETLTARQRSSLLRKLQGWTVAEIQGELGTTRGAVYKLMHDARKKLKQTLEDAGFDGDVIRELFSD